MSEEMEGSGGIVASQASVVIGADWGAVDSAFAAVERLDTKLKTFNPNIEVKLKMPDVKSLTATIDTQLKAAFAKPYTVNVAAKLQADSLASIQAQLSAQVFTIKVKPEVVGGAPISGNAATSYSAATPPRFGSTGYRAPSYGGQVFDDFNQSHEEFSGAYQQQMMQQNRSGIPRGPSSFTPSAAERQELMMEARRAELGHAAERARLGFLAQANRGFNPGNAAQSMLGRFALTEEQGMKLQQEARRAYFAGQTLTRTVTLPAAMIGGAMIYQGGRYDTQFGKIGALTDTDPSLIPGLKQQTIDLSMSRGMRYPVSSTAPQIADTLYEVASAGYVGSGGRRVTKASVEGSTVGLGDPKVVADVVTDVLAAYKMDPSQSREIVNKLLKGVIFGKGEASQYAPALPKVISTAAIAGQGFDQVMGSLATLSRIGIKPEAGATALNQMLMHLNTPSPEGTKAFAKMGWTPQSAKADMKRMGLSDFAFEIIRRSDKVSPGGDGSAIQEQLLGNVRGWKALAGTAGTQAEAYRAALTKINDGNDQLSQSLKVTADTVEMQWKRIYNAISGTALKIEQGVMPRVTKVVSDIADKLPEGIGRAGDVLDMAGTPGKTALGVGIGAAALMGPAFHTIAVAKDFESWRANGTGSFSAAGGVGAALALPFVANYAAQQGYAPQINDNALLAAQFALGGSSSFGYLRGMSAGVESGTGRFAANATGLYGRTRSTFNAYTAARAAEGIESGLAGNVASFLPWMLRGGAVNPGSPAAVGMFARLGGTPSLTGLAGAGSVAGLGIAALGAWDYSRQMGRELGERSDARRALDTGATIIDKQFEKASAFAVGSPEASSRLGDIATKFSGAATDAGQLRDRIKELNQLKIDINAGTLKVSPLAAQELRSSADKIIGQVESQIKAVEVQLKIKTSYEGFKDDVSNIVHGQQGFQKTNANWISGVGVSALDVLGVGRFVGNKMSQAGAAVPTWLGFEPNGAALPLPAGRASLRPSVNSRGQFVTPTGPSVLADSAIERAIEGLLGIKLRNGTDIAGFIGKADKGQIDKLSAALTGKDKDRLGAIFGGDMKGRIVARQAELKNLPGNVAGGGGVPGVPTQAEVDALEKQRRALESNAESMNKLAGAYGNYGSIMDGIIGKTRSMSDETEKSALINQLYKRSLDGVDGSLKSQAITVAALNDRMKELQGTKNTLRGFNEGLENAVSGIGGNLGSLRAGMGRESALLGYDGRMGLLSQAALSRGAGLATLANGQMLDYQQSARNFTAQAGAVGSDTNNAFTAIGKGQPFIGGDPGGGTYGGVKPWVAASGHRIASRFHPLGIGGVGGRGNESDHPFGKALDFMVMQGGLRATGPNLQKGNEIAAYAQGNAGQENVSYVIWNDKIWSPGRSREGWRPYVNPQLRNKTVNLDSNAYNTLQHRDHVHVSYRGASGSGASSTPVSDAHQSVSPATFHNAKGKPFSAKTAIGADREQGDAPVNPQRFDGIDDSISGRSMDLQWALGKRIRPNQYNQNRFALQQFLEQKGVQLSLGNLARQYKFGADGKTKLTDKEVAELSGMDSMSEPQLKKLLASKPAILKKLVGLVQGNANNADYQVNKFAGDQTALADSKASALGLFAAKNPLDAIGLKRLQLSQDATLSPAQRSKMLGNFTDIQKAGSWTEAHNQLRGLNDNSKGYAAGLGYISGNRNWNEQDVSIEQQLSTFKAQQQYQLGEQYKGESNRKTRDDKLATAMRLESYRLRAPQRYQQRLNYAGDSREAWNASDDATSLGYKIGLGQDSELAGMEVQRDAFSRNYQQSGRGTLGEGKILARVNYNTQLQGLENNNLSRYNQQVKDISRSMASLGDTTGNVATAFDLFDDKLGRGIGEGQKFTLLTKNLELQQKQRDFQIGMDSAPLFYGPGGARNEAESAQAKLDELRRRRDGRTLDMMNNGIPAPVVQQQLNSEEKAIQDQIDNAKRTGTRSMHNQSINSFEATKDHYQEELAALGALSDKEKERLFILKEQNRYKEEGRKFDYEALITATKQAAEQRKMEKDLEYAQRMRGMIDQFKSVSGSALEKMFSNNGAEAEGKRQDRLNESYRWANLSMDLYDRGYGADSSEYKNAEKRHRQLEKDAKGKGALSALFSDTFGGWADVARKTSAGAVNDAIWGKIGPIFGGALLPSDKKKGGALGSIVGISGGAAGGGDASVQTMTVQAQNLYVNGQNQGQGGIQLGGSSSAAQGISLVGSLLHRSRG